MIGHKTNLTTFKKIEIIPTGSSNHNGIKLELNSKKKVRSTNIWKINNTLLNNNWVKERVKKKIKTISRNIEN